LKNQIYVSSLAFAGKSITDISKIAKKYNLAVEFTSSFKYSAELKENFLKANIKKSIHNYFPPPESRFVLNLASENEVIRKKSIDHCIEGLKISSDVNSDFFAAHAGFCIDPKSYELGNRINYKLDFNKENNKLIFIDSVREILKSTESLNTMFFIENNVISMENMDGDINPLLCCDSSEIIWLFNGIKDPKFGILLDTAHFKVSCKTLNNNIDDEFNKIRPYVKAIHHSDNDGYIDNNMPISENYWFINYLKYFKNATHVIEVKNLDETEIIEQINILKKAWI